MIDDSSDIRLQKLSTAKLGQLIALILTQSTPEQLPDFRDRLDKNDLSLWKTVDQFMQNSPSPEQNKDWQALLVPEPCRSTGSLLRRKPEILLALFNDHIAASPPERPLCQYLFQHLNGCFPCFEHYTEVMQSFYLTYSEINKKITATKKK